jgi:hypothetical protein
VANITTVHSSSSGTASDADAMALVDAGAALP